MYKTLARVNGRLTTALIYTEAYMIRAILSAVLFGVVSVALARNGIEPKKASYWLIMGCAVAIALVYYFVK